MVVFRYVVQVSQTANGGEEGVHPGVVRASVNLANACECMAAARDRQARVMGVAPRTERRTPLLGTLPATAALRTRADTWV